MKQLQSLLFIFVLTKQTLNHKFPQCDLTTAALPEYASSPYNVPRVLTTRSGSPIGDKLNSLTVGPRGPVLLQDSLLIEEVANFDRERIPERVVHAKGAGAHGFFVVTHPDIQKYTRASVFDHVGKKTRIFVRFSQVSTERGSSDTVRNPRGFAIKFYTDEGIWDLVGNNTPLFFIKDAILFPSFIHSQKRNPKTFLVDWNAVFDFYSLRPESLHQMTYMYTDRGIPDGYPHMHGFGSNTFKLVDKHNNFVYCKFHYLSNQGIKNLDPKAAARIAGEDPDYLLRDLYNRIERREYPSWTMYIQVMTPEQADQWYYNPFDATKVWPHKEFPLIQVGQLVLNRNPSNYFAEVEQSAFDVANMPPGIEPSPDKLLQGRMFSYWDTQRHRLEKNFQRLPINRPPFKPNDPTIRDGFCVSDDNFDAAPNYFPTAYSKSFVDPQYKQARFRIKDSVVGRYEPINEDDYGQVRLFWTHVLDEGGRQRTAQNLAQDLKNAQRFIQSLMLHNLEKVHPEYAAKVRLALFHTNTTACT